MIKRRLMIVDDDVELRDLLRDELAGTKEFTVLEAGSIAEAREKIAAGPLDLVLLDVGLPDMDGREGLKLLRSEGFRAPVIMLTGQDSETDEITGLESGAIDYVTKPFRFSVLLARIRVALRQHDQSEDVVFAIGPYRFHPAAKTLENGGDGTKIRLTDKETSILKFLYRQGPRTISRDILLSEVWGYNNRVTTHTLETHIYRLRQKIERDPSNARLLVTEEGGYRLVP